MKLPGWTTGLWCGDVWKTICYLRCHRTDLRIFVLNVDMGLGKVMRRKAESYLNLSDKKLDEMTFKDLAMDKITLLNLKDESYFLNFWIIFDLRR